MLLHLMRVADSRQDAVFHLVGCNRNKSLKIAVRRGRVSIWPDWPWRRRHYNPSKRRQLFTSRYDVTSRIL